jgi:hypothetical protein
VKDCVIGVVNVNREREACRPPPFLQTIAPDRGAIGERPPLPPQQQKIAELTTLQRVGAVNSTLDLSAVLVKVLDQVALIFEADIRSCWDERECLRSWSENFDL